VKRSKDAIRLATRLAALPEPEMKRHVLLEALRAQEPREAAELLSEILVLSREGRPAARLVHASLADLLQRDDLEYDLVAQIYERAKGDGHEALAELLVSSRTIVPALPSSSTARFELTLGHRKSMARSPRREVIAKLLASPEPEVIDVLLRNPKLTEKEVVRLAARRPTYGEIQRAIATCERWAVRRPVRSALVLNPHTPHAISSRLLGLLDGAALSLVAEEPSLSEALRNAARRLYALRRRDEDD
jgi:hypothetical protein